MIKLINILKELVTATEVICDSCGWKWKIKDGGDDLYICHKCNHDNTPEQLKEEKSTTELQFPDGFQPAKSVPKGGAMCANCAKWNKKTQLCEGQYYIDWHGNGEIHADPTEYICIWWVDKKK
jgi:hypothetical protein